MTRRWSKALAAPFAALIAGIVFISESDTLRPWRIDIGSTYLSDVVGQTVLIEGDVDLDLFPRLSLETHGVRLPSEELPGTDLLTLDYARLYLGPWDGVDGWTQIPAMEAQGLHLTLLQFEDGTRTWSTRVAPTQEPDTPQSNASASDQALLRFLARRDVAFSDMRVTAENRGTGFVFDFALNGFLVVSDVSAYGTDLKFP
jgi:uncharacterized protein involved in outer membrane biogenesis